jgi:hypothetical protein
MKVPSLTLIGLAACVAVADAQTYPTSAIASGTPGSATTIWTETSPGILTSNNSGSVLAEISGSVGATGGNVELFTQSDLSPYKDASAGGLFANASHVTLQTTFASGTTTVFSSLNGSDWFTNTSGTYSLSYGENNLANKWFQDFMTRTAVGSVIDSVNPLLRSYAYNAWVATGGFSRISDPNIAFAYEDSFGAVNFGLAAFLDDSPMIRTWLSSMDPTGYLASLVPDGIQLSEAVIVNGKVTYNFQAAQTSGVVVNDGLNSYAGVYSFTVVPEASSASLALISSILLLRRRRSDN